MECEEFSPLNYGNFFSQDPLSASEQSEPTNNNKLNNKTDTSEVLDKNQITSQQNELTINTHTSQLDNDGERERYIPALKKKPIIRSVIETNKSYIQ